MWRRCSKASARAFSATSVAAIFRFNFQTAATSRLSSCPRLSRASRLGTHCSPYRDGRDRPGHDRIKPTLRRPVFWSGDGCACLFPGSPKGESPPCKKGERSAEKAHKSEPRLRGAARTLRSVRLASRRSTAAIFALPDCSKRHPERPFGLLIPPASAGFVRARSTSYGEPS
jgi:hypothetical protein